MRKHKQAKRPIQPVAGLSNQPPPAERSADLDFVDGRKTSDGSDSPLAETLRECFSQASQNARAYMDLRFKHFGTFVVLVGLFGTATFQVAALTAIRPLLASVSLIITALFWLLDFRTSQHLADELHRIRAFKQLLRVPSTNVPRHRVLLRASNATNLIFLSVFVMWTLILIHLRDAK
jgi:hypothetical protein